MLYKEPNLSSIMGRINRFFMYGLVGLVAALTTGHNDQAVGLENQLRNFGPPIRTTEAPAEPPKKPERINLEQIEQLYSRSHDLWELEARVADHFDPSDPSDFSDLSLVSLQLTDEEFQFAQEKEKTHKSNTAVVVVDMQAGFVDSLEPSVYDDLLSAQNKTLEYCRSQGYPIYLVEFAGNGPTISDIRYEFDQFKYGKCIYVKGQNNGMGQALYNQLKSTGVENIIFTGLNRSICVLSTILGAKNAGFNVMTAGDLTADQPFSYFDKDSNTQISSESMKTMYSILDDLYLIATNYATDHEELISNLESGETFSAQPSNELDEIVEAFVFFESRIEDLEPVNDR